MCKLNKINVKKKMAEARRGQQSSYSVQYHLNYYVKKATD
jgi:hypothetical protein